MSKFVGKVDGMMRIMKVIPNIYSKVVMLRVGVSEKRRHLASGFHDPVTHFTNIPQHKHLAKYLARQHADEDYYI